MNRLHRPASGVLQFWVLYPKKLGRVIRVEGLVHEGA
jgi:hypothetical protein